MIADGRFGGLALVIFFVLLALLAIFGKGGRR